MDDLIEQIESTDDIRISQIIRAVIRRYSQLHPDWDLCFVSLPKQDEAARQAYIHAMNAFLSKTEKQKERSRMTSLFLFISGSACNS